MEIFPWARLWGGLREPLQDALRFCESFRLKVVSTPGQGLQVTGEEHRIRLTMTELFGVHFHQAEPDPRDREYLVWIGCAQQERQDIRHAFLKLLRESPYAVRDSVSQRVSMYLIIARNRRRAGLGVSLPDDWVREIRTTPLYQLAQSIYGTLGARFPGYRMDQAETAFLAIYLLSNLDPVPAVPLRLFLAFLLRDRPAAAGGVSHPPPAADRHQRNWGTVYGHQRRRSETAVAGAHREHPPHGAL